MKKIFTLTLLLVFSTMVSFAQGSKQLNSFKPFTGKATPSLFNGNALAKTGTKHNPSRRAIRKDPPAGAETATLYTVGGNFYNYTSSGWSDYTSQMPEIQVAISGSTVYVQGLAYWFDEAWVEGTISGSTVTFASGQLLGSDEYGDEYLIGSDDGSTVCDIVFEYDEDAGTVTQVTKYVAESSEAESMSAYTYWYNAVFSFTEPEEPEVVTPPADLTTEEYAVTARNYNDDADVSGYVNIGFDGNDVYVQGLCTYIPDAWVKGTLSGATVTFENGQYFGNYAGSYDMYLNTLMGEPVVLDYDATEEKFTAQNAFFLVDNSSYYFDSYRGAVFSKVVEKAAMPANPSITGMTESESYGWYIDFNVPNVDTNGDALSASKLYYEIFVDVEHEISPLTFTPETHEKLEEDLTIIPFGFTENWDFYSTTIYLNDLYSEDWNQIGIKSIYEGGGETNETEIQWFSIKDYTTEDPNHPKASWVASEQGYENAQEISDFTIDENISGNSGKGSGTVIPKYYTVGAALRLYGGNVLTISAGDNVASIDKIVFNFSGNTYTGELEASASAVWSPAGAPAYAYSVSGTTGTWTGSGKTVTFNNSTGQARILSIDVTYTLSTTGITDLTNNGQIVSEKYFDLQGRAATANTRGVLLKQTRDSQGLVKTVKVIRK